MPPLEKQIQHAIEKAQKFQALEEAKPLPEQYNDLKDYQVALSAWQMNYLNTVMETKKQEEMPT